MSLRVFRNIYCNKKKIGEIQFLGFNYGNCRENSKSWFIIDFFNEEKYISFSEIIAEHLIFDNNGGATIKEFCSVSIPTAKERFILNIEFERPIINDSNYLKSIARKLGKHIEFNITRRKAFFAMKK